jgi:hypothetical protein
VTSRCLTAVHRGDAFEEGGLVHEDTPTDANESARETIGSGVKDQMPHTPERGPGVMVVPVWNWN